MIDQKMIDEYLTPEFLEAFLPLTGLTDNEHWAVYIYLLMNPFMSLTGITKKFDSSYHELKPILEDLIRADLAEQFIMTTDEAGDLDRRFYRVSRRGIRFYCNSFDAIIPRRKQ